MSFKNTETFRRDRFLKLSLKKNKLKNDQELKDNNSDVIILDESFDSLKSSLTKNVHSSPVISSPIVINTSCESTADDSLPKVKVNGHKPSRNGNVSFNHSFNKSFPKDQIHSPSLGGWSPCQNMVCAATENNHIPHTPIDVANVSMEECSIKKVHKSHQKILDELYGEVWRSIPKLFKPDPKPPTVLEEISKKLLFDDDDDDENDKENVRNNKKEQFKLYLTESAKRSLYADLNETNKKSRTESETKRTVNTDLSETNKKSRKKLYTEKVPNTPVPKAKPKSDRNVNSTTKKLKQLSVTQLVDVMNKDVDSIAKKVKEVSITPTVEKIDRISFVGSLADNVPSWRYHIEAIQYHDKYKTLREQLTKRLYEEFNEKIFGNALHKDMPLVWDSKLRSTAGTTTNRLIKTTKGDKYRTSSIKLSTKVLDGPQRLRDTLVHEMCHAATWLIDGEIRAGHGPLWKKWATRALRVFPELGEISRCHDLQIHFKYCYKCSKCGYSIQRHSKSIDITKKCCGYCHGTFDIILNKKNKEGVVVSTPARKAGPNGFALYVKEHYSTVKDDTKTHAQVMKILGERYSVMKNQTPGKNDAIDCI